MTTCIPTGFNPQNGTIPQNMPYGTPFAGQVGWNDPTHGGWPAAYTNTPYGNGPVNFVPGCTPTNYVPAAYPTNWAPTTGSVNYLPTNYLPTNYGPTNFAPTPWGFNPFVNPVNTFNPFFSTLSGYRPAGYTTPFNTAPGTPWNTFTPPYTNTFNPYVNTINPFFFNTVNSYGTPWNFGGINQWNTPWSHTQNTFPGFNGGTPWSNVGTPWGINPGFQGPWNNVPGVGYVPGYTNNTSQGYPSPIGAPIPGMNVEQNEKTQKRGILNRDAA